MGKFRSILLLCLGFLLVHVRGQHDFDLADALDHPEDIITRKPTVIRRPTRPVLNNDLHLGDALGGGDIPHKPLYPPLPPRPGSYGNSGGFDDSDLIDGKPLPPFVPGSICQHSLQLLPNTCNSELASFALVLICFSRKVWNRSLLFLFRCYPSLQTMALSLNLEFETYP
ncbi:glycoprotein Xg isoform X1 [Phaenicophaeus curvirostris]|uniref:glycoprotein Xg isoform X1 n=1 Tax=Phaenicophaeus curvirostris TaxID=33595 RepID=UPI0037F0F9A9